MAPLVVSENFRLTVADCADPVPVKANVLYGDPSDDGQREPPPLVRVAAAVRLVSTTLALVGNAFPEVFVMVTFWRYVPAPVCSRAPSETDTSAVTSRQAMGMVTKPVETPP